MVQVAHFFATLSFLLATSSVVNAVATPKIGTIDPVSELFGTISRRGDANPLGSLAVPSPPDLNAPKKRITNAERLARGMPLLKPTRRYTGCESNTMLDAHSET
jgi:hypothetical protein